MKTFAKWVFGLALVAGVGVGGYFAYQHCFNCPCKADCHCTCCCKCAKDCKCCADKKCCDGCECGVACKVKK